MKAKDIKFDKLRPVFFGFAAIAKFEELTDTKISEIDKVLADGKLKDIIAFAYSGLYGGAKKVGSEVNFTIDDVANWLDDVKDLGLIFEQYIQCMPMAQGGTAEESTKKKP